MKVEGGVRKGVSILGTRGVPAQHGGFETFAARLAPYLAARGWAVSVYCQQEGSGPVEQDEWQGVRRVHIPVLGDGPIATMRFDWRSVSHLLQERQDKLALTLGYNTAVFGARLRASGVVNVFNMDGLEWQRKKWGFVERAWLWFNERVGCLVGNHLIADHPAIGDHLATRVARKKITVIPYGADLVRSASEDCLGEYGLCPGEFVVLIARPEPENSVLEIVRAFSAKPRGIRLVVLGSYLETVDFHCQVRNCASDEVLFLGAVYDKDIVSALRFFSRAYVHGHRVGGTNPSLVEALGAGCPVIAHDNPFNKWVAGQSAFYFRTEEECSVAFEQIASASPEILADMKKGSYERYLEEFTWESILQKYEGLLESWHRASA